MEVNNGDVQFIDQTIYNPNSWQWDFGDGNTSAQTNIHTIKMDYNITLITSNNFGADIQITNFLDITIAFLHQTLLFCNGSNLLLQMEDTSNSLFWYNISLENANSYWYSFVTSPLYNSTTYYVEKVIN